MDLIFVLKVAQKDSMHWKHRRRPLGASPIKYFQKTLGGGNYCPPGLGRVNPTQPGLFQSVENLGGGGSHHPLENVLPVIVWTWNLRETWKDPNKYDCERNYIYLHYAWSYLGQIKFCPHTAINLIPVGLSTRGFFAPPCDPTTSTESASYR